MKVFLFLVIMVYVAIPVFSQQYSTRDKKAIKIFEQAEHYYEYGHLQEAILLIPKALERDAHFIEPYLLLSDIYHEQGKTSEEINALKKVLALDSLYNEKIYLLLGKTEYKIGAYNDAVTHLSAYLRHGSVHQDILEAKKWLDKSKFAAYAVEHPVPFKPILLSTTINSPYKDYWPSLTADEQELYYTVQMPSKQVTPMGTTVYQEDIFVSKKGTDNTWQPSHKVESPVNTDDNEGSSSISANGQFLFYVACNRKEDYGACDIYYAERIGNSWSVPKNIGPPINTSYWESTPASSADGRILFFSSGGRPDSKGGKDIYVSYKKEDGTWTEPQNLGDSINTEGNEYAPFLHPDGRTLYFSSDGWTGMGGQDIFYARMKEDSTWSTPVNIGYPINTPYDDFGLIVNAKGNYAFFASNREGTQDWDLFTFELYPEARPNPVTYVKGIVYDAKTHLPLSAMVEIIELDNKTDIYKATTIMPQGTYLACIPLKHNYAMNVNAPGYLFYSENFSLEKSYQVGNPYELNIPLQPIMSGSIVVLKNIFYETDKFDLKPESEIELKKLLQFLNQNATVKIEISGYTDNEGSAEHNITLSTNRAKTVYHYLIQHGISSERLKYTGYGFTNPIASNNTEEGKALNRRTEFKIIGK